MAVAQQTRKAQEARERAQRYVVVEKRKAETAFDRETRGLWHGSTDYQRALDKYNRRLAQIERMARAAR